MPIAPAAALRPAALITPAAGVADPAEIRTTFPDGMRRPARLIEWAATPLVVGVAPWALVAELEAAPELAGPVVYGLVGLAAGPRGLRRAIYWGKADVLASRTRRHRREPRLDVTETAIVVAGGRPGVLGFELSLAVEAALSRATERAGAYAVINEYATPPLRPAQVAAVNRWLVVLDPMLTVAGVPALAPPPAPLLRPVDPAPATTAGASIAAPAPAPAQPAPAVPRGWREDPPVDLIGRPDAEHYLLDRGGVTARAVVSAGWAILLAGSTVRADEIASMQTCLSAKRARLQACGVFAPMPGRPGLRQVTRSVAMPSLTNIARAALGTNAPGTIFTRIR